MNDFQGRKHNCGSKFKIGKSYEQSFEEPQYFQILVNSIRRIKWQIFVENLYIIVLTKIDILYFNNVNQLYLTLVTCDKFRHFNNVFCVNTFIDKDINRKELLFIALVLVSSSQFQSETESRTTYLHLSLTLSAVIKNLFAFLKFMY